MGEPSTSENNQEIPEFPVSGPESPYDGPHDDPAHEYSGFSSRSQSSPEEDHPASGTLNYSPDTPLDPFPEGSDPSSSESPKESDHQEISASPSSDGTNVVHKSDYQSETAKRKRSPSPVQPLVAEDHLVNPGKNADSSSNIPEHVLSGEAAGRNIDQVMGKKTGSDGNNPVMDEGKAMLQGFSSDKANAGDVPGNSGETAKRDETKDETESSDDLN